MQSLKKNSNYKVSLRAESFADTPFPPNNTGKEIRKVLVRASMTVEASLVLPLFIFFMVNVLYIFEMIRLQSNITAALHETGTEMAEYAYYYRYGLSDIAALGKDFLPGAGGDMNISISGAAALGISVLMSETYVREKVNTYLGEAYIGHTCLEGGSGGISYLRSQILVDNDVIDLVADYKVKPFIPMGNFEGFSMQSRFYAHAWVGFNEGHTGTSSEEQEVIVFITPTGTVYHKSRQCTYLKPSVEWIPASALTAARNNNGGKYYACESCHPTKAGMVVITTEGNRYHDSSSCSSIKRTVLEVPISSVKDTMKACSKCGG